ncbi:MAG: type IV pilin protein [Armatimonadota bacterium]
MNAVPKRDRRCGGFTMLEWMMVLLIFWVLVALFLAPRYRAGVQRARRASCASNLDQLGTALLMYSYDNAGRFPPAGGFPLNFADYTRNERTYACPTAASNEEAPVFLPTARPPGSAGKPSRYDYAYIGGHTNDGPPDAPILADSRPRHRGGANVLFGGGDVRWCGARLWTRMGFAPPSAGGDLP